MMKKLTIVILFFFNVSNFYAQVNELDTIQYLKTKKIFNVKLKKTDNKKYVLTFVNLSKKDIYISESEYENYEMATDIYDEILFGVDILSLGDFKHYVLFKIKPGETYSKKYISNGVRLGVVVSFVFENRFIIKKGKYITQKRTYLMDKFGYFKKMKSFKYSVKINK